MAEKRTGRRWRQLGRGQDAHASPLRRCVAAFLLVTAGGGCSTSAAPSDASATTAPTRPYGTYSLDDKGCIRDVNAGADTYCPLPDGAKWPSGGDAIAVPAGHGSDIIVSITASGTFTEVKHGVATMFGTSVAVFADPEPNLELRVREGRGTFICVFNPALYPALPDLKCQKAP